jgi:translocation and assembly module TamB
VITAGASEIAAEGLFSLGYPRKDGGEQINARVRLTRRPMSDLKRAFELDDYDMDGLVSGEYHVYGNYETPLGFGRLLIEEGVAYGETFETMTSALRFEGTGVRLDTIDIKKASGTATGAAYVGWNGDYSFNVDGRRIPIESLKTVSFPTAPLSGLLQFNATGAGRFEEPRYDVKLRIDDLFAGDEGVGAVTGRLAIRGTQVTGDFEAASPRLFVSGSGRVAMTDRMEADMNLRFQDTSLDPYVRFFEPRLSPFTTAVAGGTIRVTGELADINRLSVDTQVEQLDLKLFDYALKNDGVIDLALNKRRVDIRRLRVIGEGTQLQLGGQIDLAVEAVNVEATGEANLGILQGFFRNLRSRGTAALLAHVKGPLTKPTFSGSARLADGRIRHLSLPHGLEAINGIISFDGSGIRLEDVAARMAGGQARFGGRIAMTGFAPSQLSLTAVGEQMRVRYPEGFNSLIDADLWLRGDIASPVLGGMVTVHDARWTRRFELDPSLFDFVGSSGPTLPSGTAAASTLPLRFDIQVNAANTLQIRNNLADVWASADLKLQGTYDRPALFGRAEIDRGSIVFEGNRYVVTRGTIDFLTPPAGRIEPIFDIEAETRVRVPSQTFRITLGLSGTMGSPSLTLGSDPPLSNADIIGLLVGTSADVTNELRSLSPDASTAAEEALLRAAGARLITGTISAPVRRVVEETFGLETAQIAPTFGTDNDPSTASARLILGKRLSSRAYISYTRPLGNAARDQVIILEYDQNDRVGFVLTQTGDRTFAIDFRVRHSF